MVTNFNQFLSLKLAIDAMPRARKFFSDFASDKIRIRFCPKLGAFYIERDGQLF